MELQGMWAGLVVPFGARLIVDVAALARKHGSDNRK